MSHFHQEYDFEQQSDLPELFTDQIIRHIRNKNTQIIVGEEVQNPDDLEQQSKCGESILQQFASKISNRRMQEESQEQMQQQQQENEIIEAEPPRRKPNKMTLTENSIGQLQSKRVSMQTNKEQFVQQGNSILNFQRTLKQYFQDYLTRILSQMQSVTNSKLQQIGQRISAIQKSFPNLSPRCGSTPQKKGSYIKNKEKLQYIEKIQKGKLSIGQVAEGLNLKQKIVRSWMVNKQVLREKERAMRKQKKYQKELNNIL